MRTNSSSASRVEVTGRGEGRHPGVAVAVGVPPDVIGVQVRVHDELARAPGVKPGVGEPFEERQVEVVPHRQPAHLAVADTRVDEHGEAVDLDDERLRRAARCCRRRRPSRARARDGAARSPRSPRGTGARRDVDLVLDDARDRRRPDLPRAASRPARRVMRASVEPDRRDERRANGDASRGASDRRRVEHAAVSERPASVQCEMKRANWRSGEPARTAEGAPAREPDKEIWWAGLDSNQRSGNATGLQPVPFGHSGTDPDLI